ncbi:hypothetical protein FB645_005581 [Coemansia sp. IMI 203386]|nr:hypothetical protein FB645_005581 [Coemansia sp. IMI 203386]
MTWLASAPSSSTARSATQALTSPPLLYCHHAITAAAATASGDWSLRGAVDRESERGPSAGSPAYCENVTRAARERATAKRRPSLTSQKASRLAASRV